MKMIGDAWGRRSPKVEACGDLAHQVDHDIRSPLTAICSYAECFTWLNTIDGPTREKYSRAIIAEAQRLGRLVANFVVLATAPEADKLEEIGLDAVMCEVLAELTDLVQLQNMGLDYVPAPASVKLLWPPATLKHLLLAVVEASLDAAGPHGTLVIRASASESDQLSLRLRIAGELSHDITVGSFAYRAADLLVRSHGGSLTKDARGGGLQVQLPCLGRLKTVEMGLWRQASA